MSTNRMPAVADGCLGPEAGASLLWARGIREIAEDHQIIGALIEAGIGRREIPDDLTPIRTALRKRVAQAVANPFEPEHLGRMEAQSRMLAQRLQANHHRKDRE